MKVPYKTQAHPGFSTPPSFKYLLPQEEKGFIAFLTITRSYYFFALVVGFCVFSYFYLDQPIAFYMKFLAHPYTTKIAQLITELGKGLPYFISLPIIFIFAKFVFKNKNWERNSGFLLLCITVTALICNILKMVLGRTRPTLWFHHDLYQFIFWQTDTHYLSFPSGHSMLITSLMLGLCFIFTRYWLIFISLALIISASRLVVTAHYLSDVVTGIYLSILIVPWLYQKLRFRI